METIEYYGGTYPEPDWCYKDEKEQLEENYEEYMSDIMYEEKMLEMLEVNKNE